MAWLTGWNRRKSKIVNGSTAGTQANYQMQLTIHKGSGADTSTDIYLGTNVRNDFGDVRFTKSDGSSLLNYWIESYTSGSSATVWIQIDSIPASPSSSTIYIYYDNSPQTTTSNGTNTFEFFDDFSGDLSKWTLSSSNTISISNSILQVGAETAGQYIRSNNIITINDLAFEFKLSRDVGTCQWTAVIHGAANPNSNGYLYSIYPPINYRKIFRDGTSIGTDRGTAINDINTWHNYKLVRKSSGILELWEDNILIKDATGETGKTSGYVGFTTLPETLRNIKIDDVRIRKYASPEPTFGCSGGEEIYTISWLTGWNRRKSKIINGSTSAQTNYQMRLTVHKAAGIDTSTDIYLGTNVRNDFGDVRFTKSDGSSLLNYWIESISGTTALAWIQIDSIQASPCTSAIYIYYDNPSAASTSNGTNTFEFFDDFLGSSLGSAWTAVSGVSVANSILTLSSATDGQAYTGLIFNPGIVMRTKEKRYGTVGSGNRNTDSAFHDNTWRNSYDSPNVVTAGTDYNTGKGHIFWSRKAGSGIASAYNSALVDDGANWHIVELTWSNNLVKFMWDNNTIGSSTGTTYIPVVPQRLQFDIYTNQLDVDWVAVHKYTSPEPTFGLSSAEELNITAIAMTLSTNICTGPCSITANVTWQNLSTSSITFRPAILVDGTILAYAASDITIATGGTGSSLITTSTLAIGTHSICPYPN